MTYLTIPWHALSSDALEGVIEEFVTRDGTDYGAEEVALSTRVAQVRSQLQRGDVAIVFDDGDGRCQIVTRQALRELVDEY